MMTSESAAYCTAMLAASIELMKCCQLWCRNPRNEAGIRQLRSITASAVSTAGLRSSFRRCGGSGRAGLSSPEPDTISTFSNHTYYYSSGNYNKVTEIIPYEEQRIKFSEFVYVWLTFTVEHLPECSKHDELRILATHGKCCSTRDALTRGRSAGGRCPSDWTIATNIHP